MTKRNRKHLQPKSERDVVLKLIKKHELEAEYKATNSLERGKFMMYGYWKAIGVHMRRLFREMQKEMDK